MTLLLDFLASETSAQGLEDKESDQEKDELLSLNVLFMHTEGLITKMDVPDTNMNSSQFGLMLDIEKS